MSYNHSIMTETLLAFVENASKYHTLKNLLVERREEEGGIFATLENIDGSKVRLHILHEVNNRPA